MATGNGCPECAIGGGLVIYTAFAPAYDDSKGSGRSLFIGYFRGWPGRNCVATAWTCS